MYNRSQTQPDTMELYKEGPSFGEMLNTLWLRKRLIIIVTLLTSLIAGLLVAQISPRYKANAKLLIGTDSKVVEIQSVMVNDLMGESAVLGEIEVIKSRALAKRVIKALHLDLIEEFNASLKKRGSLAFLRPKNWVPEEYKKSLGLNNDSDSVEQDEVALLTLMTDVFLKKLKVSQVNRTQIVIIEMQSENRQLAAKIANELANSYIVGQMEAKFEATKKATAWLNGQLSTLKDKVEESERAIEMYRQAEGLTQVDGIVGLSQQQLSELNSQLIIARTQRAEAGARMRQVQRLIKQGGKIGSVSEVLNSSLIQRLKEQESVLERKSSEMSVEFGKKHPKMIHLQAELGDIKANIQSEVQKIAVSLRNELEVAKTRESSLRSSLKQIQEDTGGDREAEVGLRALEREASANRILFETFLTRFKETTSTQGMDEMNARVISKAEVPLEASFPQKKTMLIASVFIGFFLSVAIVIVLELIHSGLRSPEQVEEYLGLPTLGVIPLLANRQVVHDYALDKPRSSLTEAINTLRVSLMLLNPDEQVKSLLVTSAIPAEGKSTLAMLVARISAQAGQKVVLVDADIRHPLIEQKLGLDPRKPGLTDLLMQHDLAVNDVLLTDDKSGMKILSCGMSAYVSPADLFASQRMQKILSELKNNFDLVILDSPPVMAVTDSRVLSHLVDKTLFVLRWDDTPRKIVGTALQQMSQSGGNNVAGIIFQQVDLKQYDVSSDSGYSQNGQYYIG